MPKVIRPLPLDRFPHTNEQTGITIQPAILAVRTSNLEVAWEAYGITPPPLNRLGSYTSLGTLTGPATAFPFSWRMVFSRADVERTPLNSDEKTALRGIATNRQAAIRQLGKSTDAFGKLATTIYGKLQTHSREAAVVDGIITGVVTPARAAIILSMSLLDMQMMSYRLTGYTIEQAATHFDCSPEAIRNRRISGFREAFGTTKPPIIGAGLFGLGLCVVGKERSSAPTDATLPA